MTTWSSIDAPWLAQLDRGAFGRALSAIERLDPEIVLSGHLPSARGLTRDLLGHLALQLRIVARELVRREEVYLPFRYLSEVHEEQLLIAVAPFLLRLGFRRLRRGEPIATVAASCAAAPSPGGNRRLRLRRCRGLDLLQLLVQIVVVERLPIILILLGIRHTFRRRMEAGNEDVHSG